MINFQMYWNLLSIFIYAASCCVHVFILLKLAHVTNWLSNCFVDLLHISHGRKPSSSLKGWIFKIQEFVLFLWSCSCLCIVSNNPIMLTYLLWCSLLCFWCLTVYGCGCLCVKKTKGYREGQMKSWLHIKHKIKQFCKLGKIWRPFSAFIDVVKDDADADLVDVFSHMCLFADPSVWWWLVIPTLVLPFWIWSTVSPRM